MRYNQTTRQQVFLRALAKTGFDLEEFQRVADKAMQAGRECPHCGSAETRRLTAEELECWDCRRTW